MIFIDDKKKARNNKKVGCLEINCYYIRIYIQIHECMHIPESSDTVA